MSALLYSSLLTKRGRITSNFLLAIHPRLYRLGVLTNFFFFIGFNISNFSIADNKFYFTVSRQFNFFFSPVRKANCDFIFHRISYFLIILLLTTVVNETKERLFELLALTKAFYEKMRPFPFPKQFFTSPS